MPSDDTTGLKDHSNNGTDSDDNIIDVSDDGWPKTPRHEQATSQGTKCKVSMMEHIAKVTKSECQNCFKITTINKNAKTLCVIKKEKITHHAVFELETAHLQHHAQEAAANCAHKVCMMDRQITLETAKAGNHGGPTPYTPFGIDPNLH